MPLIEDVIARIPDWQGRDLRVHPLAGGLTNTNYRVEVDGAPFVIRIPGQSTELLSVNRQHEYHNTLAAADTGVGARIVHYLPTFRERSMEQWNQSVMILAHAREIIRDVRVSGLLWLLILHRLLACASRRSKVAALMRWRT